VGVRRSWTRPVAWLAPTLTVFGAVLFSLAALPSFGAGSRDTQAHYAALAVALRETGAPFDAQHPVITNFPIWLAETLRVPALALPDESAASVASLAAAFPGTSLVVVDGRDEGRYPAAFDSGEPGAACFRELLLSASNPTSAFLADTRVFRVVCP
jgi:hypothetical protein